MQIKIDDLQDVNEELENHILELNEKLQSKKVKIRDLKDRLAQSSEEFDTLKNLYWDHLGQFERAV